MLLKFDLSYAGMIHEKNSNIYIIIILCPKLHNGIVFKMKYEEFLYF